MYRIIQLPKFKEGTEKGSKEESRREIRKHTSALCKNMINVTVHSEATALIFIALLFSSLFLIK
jgi:hypothetical protein